MPCTQPKQLLTHCQTYSNETKTKKLHPCADGLDSIEKPRHKTSQEKTFTGSQEKHETKKNTNKKFVKNKICKV